MSILNAIILGIVEGITEFLPISSTFHLIFTAQFLGIEQTEFIKLFEVVIQSGAICSVVILYARELWQNKALAMKTIIAFIPTAVIGLLLYNVVKNVFFESQATMLAAFGIVGGVFILVEYLITKGSIKISKDTSSLSIRDSLLIGLFQCFALVPGTSRAGAVMVGMMILGYKRDESAKFSFMLSIPTIFAATVLDLFQSRDVLFSSMDNVGILTVGFLTAFASSFIIVKWFISFLQNHTLVPFGIYRFIATAGIVAVLAFGGS